MQGTSQELWVTTWQPSPTQYSPTKSEQGQVVTGPMDSPRQREVTSPGQGPPTELYHEQEERAIDKAVEATCSVGPKSIQETVLKATCSVTPRSIQRQDCRQDLQCRSGVHPGSQHSRDQHTSNMAQENTGT